VSEAGATDLESGTAMPVLERRLEPIAVSLSGIGIILSAGIYVLVGEAAGEAANGVWLAFMIGVAMVAATGLAFPKLAAVFPEVGAAATYTREAFSVCTAFITGWLDIAVSTIGAVAIAFTLAEAAGLVLVIAVGFPQLSDVNLFSLENGIVGVLGAGSLVYFAYQDFEEISTLSEETINPQRNIPLAIVIAVIVTTILYILVARMAVSSLAWDQLAATDAPLANMVEAVSSDRLADVISAIALFATFNTVLLLITAGTRISYGVARRRLLPAVFGRVSKTTRTPCVATLVLTLAAIALASTGDIGFIAQVTDFSVLALVAIVNTAVIALRHSRPDAERPFRLPGTINGRPVIAIVDLLGNLGLAAYMDRKAKIASFGLLAVGILASFYIVRYERGATS